MTKETGAALERERLRGAGFEFEAYPHLCAAAEARARRGAEYEYRLLPETFRNGPGTCTVYFLGYRLRIRPTRRERGCFALCES